MTPADKPQSMQQWSHAESVCCQAEMQISSETRLPEHHFLQERHETTLGEHQ